MNNEQIWTPNLTKFASKLAPNNQARARTPQNWPHTLSGAPRLPKTIDQLAFWGCERAISSAWGQLEMESKSFLFAYNLQSSVSSLRFVQFVQFVQFMQFAGPQLAGNWWKLAALGQLFGRARRVLACPFDLVQNGRMSPK